jgi:hypothetical protein
VAGGSATTKPCSWAKKSPTEAGQYGGKLASSDVSMIMKPEIRPIDEGTLLEFGTIID